MSQIDRTNDDLRQRYERVFAQGKEGFFTFPTTDCTHEVCNATTWSGKTVLEVGCGTGETAAALASAGATVVATDYAESAIVQARAKHRHPRLDFRVGRLEDFDGPFDTIVLQEVLEHVDDPIVTLTHVQERLTAAGEVILTCPAFLNMRGYVWMTLQILLGVPMSLTDLHAISPFDVEEWAGRARLRLEHWHSFRHGQAFGAGMVCDMERRLKHALRDAGLDNSRVDELLKWLARVSSYEQELHHNGAKILYRLLNTV